MSVKDTSVLNNLHWDIMIKRNECKKHGNGNANITTDYTILNQTLKKIGLVESDVDRTM